MNATEFQSLLEKDGVELDEVYSARIEDTDIGQVIFYDRRGNYITTYEGRGQPILTLELTEYIQDNWEFMNDVNDLQDYRKPM